MSRQTETAAPRARWTPRTSAPAAFPADAPMRTLVEGRAGATHSSGAIVADRTHDGVRLSDVVSALSYALDLTEGQPAGHAARTALIGMRVGTQLGLPDQQMSALYYTCLLKDLGCSSNAARVATLFGSDDHLLKHAFKLTDWTATREAARYAFRHSLPGKGRVAKAWHMLMLGVREQGTARAMVQSRCERGADIARMLQLPVGASEAIRALDEHWDGSGLPLGITGSGIPMLARIAGLAQTVEVFQNAFDVQTACEMVHARRGRWFDPVVVDCFSSFELDTRFWDNLRHGDLLAQVRNIEPAEQMLHCNEDQLDLVAEGFARVIDAKSPYTSRHSANVAAIGMAIGEAIGLTGEALRTLRRASLLHDIGKLGVSNRILDKAGPLDDDEWEAMRRHTGFTFEILKRVKRFRRFAATAAAHHERLDGTGYHLGLGGQQLGTVARIIAVADVTEAISADRPYRAGMPIDEVFEVVNRLVARNHLCPIAAEALRATFAGVPASNTGCEIEACRVA